MRAHNLLAAALASSMLAGVAPDAAAQEYCVACTAPPATYRCVIGDVRLAGGQPLQAFCVSTLAKDGAHQSCRIKPGTVFDCDGPIKRLASGPQAPSAPAPAKEKAAPATLDQLAKGMTRSTGEQAQKAGETSGGGARNAWSCLLSFFTSC